MNLREFLPNVLGFIAGLTIAALLGWQTTDLVWSLWLSSLVVGYLTIIATITAGVAIGWVAIHHPAFEVRQRTKAVLILLLSAAFLLGFFSLHFCGFHAGHSVFLNHLFPLDSLPEDAFGDGFTNPLLLWRMVFSTLFAPYAVFLIAVLLVEGDRILEPLLRAWDTIRAGDVSPDMAALGKHGAAAEWGSRAMLRPYAAVVKIHILIFVFAGLDAAGVSDTMVSYALVYAAFFFPWEALWRRRAQASGN